MSVMVDSKDLQTQIRKEIKDIIDLDKHSLISKLMEILTQYDIKDLNKIKDKPETELTMIYGKIIELKEQNTTKLTAVERKDFMRLLVTKTDSILDVIRMEAGIDNGTLEEKIREECGVNKPIEEIKEEIKDLTYQLEGIIKPQIKDKQEEIASEIADTECKYEEKEREMKLRHSNEVRALEDEKESKIKSLKSKLKTIKEQVCKEYASDITKTITDLQNLQAKRTIIEPQIRKKIQDRQRAMERAKNTLIHALQDYRTKALEDLTLATSREEAVKTIKAIPNNSKILQSLSTPEGLNDLLKRLAPEMPMLPPPPKEEPINVKQEQIDIELENIEENEDEDN